MIARTTKPILTAALALVVGVAFTSTALAKKPAPPAPLTKQGEQLRQKYTEMLEALRAEIKHVAPKVSEADKAAYTAAREAEKAAEAALKKAQADMGRIKQGHALVGHAKGKWIGGAKKGIADTKAKLKNAKTADERKKLEKELANWEKNLRDGEQALKERQAALDAALADEPRMKRELEAAQKALAAARARTLQAVKNFKLEPFIASESLDPQLAKFMVLFEGTPRGLAAFAQQSKQHEQLVDKLLADPELMLQMVTADGASGGKYGEAMQIYTKIQNASSNAKSGVMQRFALAIALEHAVPITQRNPAGMEGPSHVDPVGRYLQFEKAYLNKELDPGFPGLSTWDYRFVVDGNEPDDTHVWGREMLRNYRPDHITTDDYKWRYVAAVRTDIRYGSQDNKHDRPDLQFFQNILMNGGVCGRRAFFGRFMLRSFGIPTTARPQRGHAALAHWTPDGWVVNLGAGWGAGWTKTRYKDDRDFLATTQAREDKTGYMKVKRAQWVGDAMGEKQVFGFHAGDPGVWYGTSLYTQKQIIEQSNAVTLAAAGEELGEANESDKEYAFESAEVTEDDMKIKVAANGAITIPAVATSNPTKSTGKIIFMDSVLGGKQLHYSRTGGAHPFEYTFNAPAAGKYKLTAHVVTPSWQQHLHITANGKAPVDLELPHTVGMWQTTDPVVVELVKGKNVLKFEHKAAGQAKGFTIKHFTLTPTK